MQKSIFEICKKKREVLKYKACSIRGPLVWQSPSRRLTQPIVFSEAGYIIQNIQWTSGKDFTVERGQQQIEEYMSTWEFHESWLHWSDYLQEEELKYSKRYHYRVRWSIPTCRKPIPQATASIYFIIEISKIKPPTLPVEVFFILESNRLIHRPGQCRFREKWLKDIIESKMILMDSITF
ncbi:A-kinase anchor protein 14 isoform X2 [Emydura macquarii macquarii]|uniref:A-kinase anchor protein 14 isoform X2 n=1 Tax=Emydura macquarii macquarii TaxID=1129001 RepID=UPI00352A70B0